MPSGACSLDPPDSQRIWRRRLGLLAAWIGRADSFQPDCQLHTQSAPGENQQRERPRETPSRWPRSYLLRSPGRLALRPGTRATCPVAMLSSGLIDFFGGLSSGPFFGTVLRDRFLLVLLL